MRLNKAKIDEIEITEEIKDAWCQSYVFGDGAFDFAHTAFAYHTGLHPDVAKDLAYRIAWEIPFLGLCITEYGANIAEDFSAKHRDMFPEAAEVYMHTATKDIAARAKACHDAMWNLED